MAEKSPVIPAIENVSKLTFLGGAFYTFFGSTIEIGGSEELAAAFSIKPAL